MKKEMETFGHSKKYAYLCNILIVRQFQDGVSSACNGRKNRTNYLTVYNTKYCRILLYQYFI